MEHVGSEQIKALLIVPCFNEEENIPLFIQCCEDNLQSLDWQVLFVNDGSSDNSLQVLRKHAENNRRVHALSFVRNFGHQNALKAGIEAAAKHYPADVYITLDADLQHPIELIPEMIKLWHNGENHIVQAQREDAGRKIPFFKKVTSALFYKVFTMLSGVNMDAGQSDFRLIDRPVLDFVVSCKDKDFFLRGLLAWSGFSKYTLPYHPHERIHGVSKFTLRKMVYLAMSGIVGYSVRPLYMALALGVCTIFLSFLYFLYVIIIFCIGGHVSVGWPSLIATILLLCGVQLFMLGILGIYVGKLFMDSKSRPTYIVGDVVGPRAK